MSVPTDDQQVPQTPSTDPTTEVPALPSFAELGLPEPLVASLGRTGIDAPFPIQAAAIPDVLAGRDVLGRGKTGSGKTLAFGLGLLTLLGNKRANPKRPLGLILVPTRELAMQVQDSLEPLGRSLGLRFKTVIGQTSMPRQIDALRRGVEVLVATPGRLKDLMNQGACDLSEVEITVLDEADHMADMGFLPDVTEILDQVRPDGQRLLFSATLDKDVDVLVKRYLNDPVTHAIGPVDEPVATMEHHLLLVAPKDKNAITAEIANREGRTILFARTKHGVDRLAKQLTQVGVRAAGLHGGKSQNLRTRTLAEFREGNIGVLVATDVAARGIHVDDVSLVVHIDPPADHKDYMHRAGRTARAGESGVVVTLVLPHQVRATSAMTRRAGIDAPRTKVFSGGGDDTLAKLTGARVPSGIPIEGPVIPERPARPARSPRSGGRFSGNPRSRGPRREGGPYNRRDADRREGGSYGDRREGGSSYGNRREGGGSFGGRREGNSYGDRPEGGSYRDRRDSGSNGDRRDGGSYGNRREGGGSYGGRRESNSYGDRSEGSSYRNSYGDRGANNSYGDRRDGGSYGGPRSESSYGGRRDGGSYGDRREGGASGDRRDGGSYGGPRSGGSFGDRRGGGSSFGGQREGGSYGGGRRSSSYGDRREGGSYGEQRDGGSYGGGRRSGSFSDRRDSRPFGERGPRKPRHRDQDPRPSRQA